MDIFMEANQFRRIHQAQQQAESAASKAVRAEQLYREVMAKHERMALICQALLELVQEKTGLTDEELYEKILEVDLRDGKADGKIGGRVTQCPGCQRTVNTRRTTCLYCGEPIQGGHAFEF